MKYLATLVVALVLLTVVGVAPVAAEPLPKTPLCHAVAGWGESGNGYNFINVSENALNGHYVDDNRQGPLHSVYNQKFDVVLQDFIPTQWQIDNETCVNEPDEPTGPEGVDASSIVCGDPRWVVTLYNTTDERQKVRLSFKSAKTGERVRVNRYIAKDTTRTLHPLWVVGRTQASVWWSGERIHTKWIVSRGPCERIFTIAS